MCQHPPASHPRRVVLSDILRCVLCGDKAKDIGEGERYTLLPCDGPICQWCELRDSWGSHWDTCAGGLAARTRGTTLRITRAPAAGAHRALT